MILSEGSMRSFTANTVRITRITMAAALPQMIACFCRLPCSERAASAITTALSPESRMLTPMISSNPIQNSGLLNIANTNQVFTLK